jgi:hypothetical protein
MLGDIVIYTLDGSDIDQINRRRVPGAAHAEGWPAGAQAHEGNQVRAGEECPAVIVREWNPGMANLQVLLDGTDTFWATSRVKGPNPGQWEEVKRDG